jgi:hypothetical protein
LVERRVDFAGFGLTRRVRHRCSTQELFRPRCSRLVPRWMLPLRLSKVSSEVAIDRFGFLALALR